MSRHIKIYDAENYSSYEDADRNAAVYSLDDVEIEDTYGLSGGLAADLILAMQLALKMVGQRNRLGAVLIQNNPVIERLT
jgi:hypothetical protein